MGVRHWALWRMGPAPLYRVFRYMGRMEGELPAAHVFRDLKSRELVMVPELKMGTPSFKPFCITTVADIVTPRTPIEVA